MPSNSAYLSTSTIPSYFQSLLRLLLRRNDYDCTWIQYGSFPDLAFVVLARLRRHRVVVTPHLGANWRSQASPILRKISKWAIGFAHQLAIFSETQSSELDLSRMPIEKIRTFLPEESLRSQNEAATSLTDCKRKLIHAARLSHDKGSFLAIDVCTHLHRANVPFSLEIIGSADDDTLAGLRKKIQASGLGEKIEIHGHMEVCELLDRIREADFLIHLSRIDSYPLIVLEALACSTLPICLDLPGARQMVEAYDGYVVDEARSDQSAAAIIEKLDIEEARSRARLVSERVICDHNWVAAGEALNRALLAPSKPAVSTEARSFGL